MRSIFVILSALALLSLGACTGMYVAGDTGAQSEHKDLAGH